MSGEEAGDGDGQADGKQDGSMGLGDGEGEKDVSDRIESEDQLDDARPAGEEKKDEDKDCKVMRVTIVWICQNQHILGLSLLNFMFFCLCISNALC